MNLNRLKSNKLNRVIKSKLKMASTCSVRIPLLLLFLYFTKAVLAEDDNVEVERRKYSSSLHTECQDEEFYDGPSGRCKQCHCVCPLDTVEPRDRFCELNCLDWKPRCERDEFYFALNKTCLKCIAVCGDGKALTYYCQKNCAGNRCCNITEFYSPHDGSCLSCVTYCKSVVLEDQIVCNNNCREYKKIYGKEQTTPTQNQELNHTKETVTDDDATTQKSTPVASNTDNLNSWTFVIIIIILGVLIIGLIVIAVVFYVRKRIHNNRDGRISSTETLPLRQLPNAITNSSNDATNNDPPNIFSATLNIDSATSNTDNVNISLHSSDDDAEGPLRESPNASQLPAIYSSSINARCETDRKSLDKPSRPLNLCVTGVGNDYMDVSWEEPVTNTGLTGYVIEIRDAFETAYKNVDKVESNVRMYRLTNLLEGHEYYVTVFAESSAGSGERAEPVKARLLDGS